VDRVIAPLAGGYPAPIKVEDLAELRTGEEDGRGNCRMRECGAAIDTRAAPARAELYRLGFAQRRLPGWFPLMMFASPGNFKGGCKRWPTAPAAPPPGRQAAEVHADSTSSPRSDRRRAALNPILTLFA